MLKILLSFSKPFLFKCCLEAAFKVMRGTTDILPKINFLLNDPSWGLIAQHNNRLYLIGSFVKIIPLNLVQCHLQLSLTLSQALCVFILPLTHPYLTLAYSVRQVIRTAFIHFKFIIAAQSTRAQLTGAPTSVIQSTATNVDFCHLHTSLTSCTVTPDHSRFSLLLFLPIKLSFFFPDYFSKKLSISSPYIILSLPPHCKGHRRPLCWDIWCSFLILCTDQLFPCTTVAPDVTRRPLSNSAPTISATTSPPHSTYTYTRPSK